MELKRSMIVGLLALVLLGLSAPGTTAVTTGHGTLERPTGQATLSSLTPSGPIVIDNDTHFAGLASDNGWAGDGSMDDPYVIAGYNITVPYMSTGVSVEDEVTVNYVVQDCYVWGESDQAYGVRLQGGNGTVTRCEAYNLTSGIVVYGSNKVVKMNTIKDAIGTGLYVVDAESAIVTRNTVTGKGNEEPFHSSGISIGGLYISNDTIIENNEIYNCLRGVNSWGNQTTIHNNTIWNCSYGISLHRGNTNITNNTLHDNLQYGLYVDYSDSHIYYNTFYNNTVHARDDGSDNVWDDGVSSGNKWDDAFNYATPYVIPGDASAQDRYPFLYELKPPTIPDLGEVNVTFGTTGAMVQWEVTDQTPDYYWLYVDGALDSSGEWDGHDLVLDFTQLPIGEYNITLVLRDMNGNTNTGQFTLHVVGPTADTETTTTTTTESSPLDTTTLLLAAGAGVVVLGVVVLVIRKR